MECVDDLPLLPVAPVSLCDPCMVEALAESERLRRIFDVLIVGGVSGTIANDVMLGYMERIGKARLM